MSISTPAVNKWENGSYYSYITILTALARLLRVNLNILLVFKCGFKKQTNIKNV